MFRADKDAPPLWKKYNVEWYERGQRRNVRVEALSPAHAKRLVSRPRRARRVSVRLGQPAIVVAEVPFRCPGGERVVTVSGPTASEAIKKAQRLVQSPRTAQIPRFLAMRCLPTGSIRLIQRR